MRGKGTGDATIFQRCRITPAYAGKSFCVEIEARWIQDHPRLCGEKFTHLRAFFHFVGSPPPMRGKVRLCLGGTKL